MQLQKAVQGVFLQLTDTLNLLTDDQYVQPSNTLSNSSIGQHTRHIIEMFICLEKGYATGTVNYENRKREVQIETNRKFAIELLDIIYNGINKPDKSLLLEADYSVDANDLTIITTNYHREVAYNLEHTIHHMALIKIGVRELSDIQLPEGFGVASSTMKYKKECVQ